jgi:hypothetical protein
MDGTCCFEWDLVKCELLPVPHESFCLQKSCAAGAMLSVAYSAKCIF